MKQKLALACTLVHEPQVILLDEPTTGVDPVSRREFWKLLSEFLSQGITILMATPYLDEAERCSRVGLLAEGKLLVVDTPGALRQSLPGVITEIIAGAAERGNGRARSGPRRGGDAELRRANPRPLARNRRRSGHPTGRRGAGRPGHRRDGHEGRPGVTRGRVHQPRGRRIENRRAAGSAGRAQSELS